MPKQPPQPQNKPPPGAPYVPIEYDVADISAWQALERGDASADQQRRCLEWLVKATAMNDLSYRPHSDRDTVFAEGKRFVGLQVRKLLSLNLRAFQKEK